MLEQSHDTCSDFGPSGNVRRHPDRYAGCDCDAADRSHQRTDPDNNSGGDTRTVCCADCLQPDRNPGSV